MYPDESSTNPPETVLQKAAQTIQPIIRELQHVPREMVPDILRSVAILMSLPIEIVNKTLL
jgi:hypothetical protein